MISCLCTAHLVCTETLVETTTCDLKGNDVRYLSAEMLDDCGQSFHPLVPLHQQPPQLADGLVLLLRLLFALTGFSRPCSVRSRCCGCLRILQTGPSPGTGSRPGSRLGPSTRASTGAGVGGVSGGSRRDWCLWCFSCCFWYLRYMRKSKQQVYNNTCN